MTIRVVLADDDSAYLERLCKVLNTAPNIEIVALCANGKPAVDGVCTHQPDVLVIDLDTEHREGLHVARQILQKTNPPAIVLMGTKLAEEHVVEAIRIGILGMVLKDLAPNMLAQCIKKVSTGEPWLELRSAARVLEMLIREREIGCPRRRDA
jgi:DNA-binding NarL/FixJ family response regulator